MLQAPRTGALGVEHYLKHELKTKSEKQSQKNFSSLLHSMHVTIIATHPLNIKPIMNQSFVLKIRNPPSDKPEKPWNQERSHSGQRVYRWVSGAVSS